MVFAARGNLARAESSHPPPRDPFGRAIYAILGAPIMVRPKPLTSAVVLSIFLSPPIALLMVLLAPVFSAAAQQSSGERPTRDQLLKLVAEHEQAYLSF